MSLGVRFRVRKLLSEKFECDRVTMVLIKLVLVCEERRQRAV